MSAFGEKPISLRNNRATRKDHSPFLEILGPSVAPARNQSDLQSAFARTIFHDFHREVGTQRTFKGALIVVRFVWLYAGQPHLRSAKFTKWSANDPLLRKKLVSPHATPPRLIGAHTQNSTITRKERGQLIRGPQS